jgi:hypothetical protein
MKYKISYLNCNYGNWSYLYCDTEERAKQIVEDLKDNPDIECLGYSKEAV